MGDYPTIWGGGQLLAFSGIDGRTDFDSGLCLRTSWDGYAFDVMNPAGTGTIIRYTETPADGGITLTGDFFEFTALKKSCGVLLDAYHLLLVGAFIIEHPETMDVISCGDRQLIAAKGFLNKAYLDTDIREAIAKRCVFLRETALPQNISETTRQCMLKALSQLKTQIYTPQGNIHHIWSTPDRWPHRRMWIWDSVFHAVGMRHYQPHLAREFISAVFDMQQEDGFIPHCGGICDISHHTQSPVLGLGIKLVEEKEHNQAWLDSILPKLKKFILWIMANRDTDGAGLVEWHIDASKTCRSGESGMDNSPRFDGAVQLDAPDFNAYLAGECEILAELLPEERDFWLGHYNRLCALMRQRLWSDDDGLFEDYDVVSEKRTGILSSAGFLPLYCGAATPEQAAIMAKHLNNPKTFGTPLRISSISASNVQAYKKDMWRGPVWVNINYLVAMGLKRYGYNELANSILKDTCSEIEKFYMEYGTLFEFYDDRRELPPPQLERKGKLVNSPLEPYHLVIHDYGWSATLYLDMVNQGVLTKW